MLWSFFWSLQSYSREEENNYETIREKSSFSRFLFVFQAFETDLLKQTMNVKYPPSGKGGSFD